MLHALATVIAAAEEKSEPDKTAFYIFGGLAAVWAVVLAMFGMRRATFPETPGAQRVVQVVSLLIVAGAMATAVITA